MAAESRGDRCPFLARRVAADPGYRRRLETADRLGIPGSQLDGREPATVTEHEYDDAGRLVRSVTTSEPRWTDLDRGEALALAEYRSGLCPLCGKPLEVCTSMEGVGPDFAAEYTACRATMAILSKQRAVLEGSGKKPNPYAPAFLWAATTGG